MTAGALSRHRVSDRIPKRKVKRFTQRAMKRFMKRAVLVAVCRSAIYPAAADRVRLAKAAMGKLNS
jgi:hypothetical protein